jgi:hypothetical protein
MSGGRKSGKVELGKNASNLHFRRQRTGVRERIKAHDLICVGSNRITIRKMQEPNTNLSQVTDKSYSFLRGGKRFPELQ